MTLSMAWIRTPGVSQELVFASDSRLSAGADWDCCPKLLALHRGDCVISFAGSTFDAYPLMLQFGNWTQMDPLARERSKDINDLKKRMRLVVNDMWNFISDLPKGQKHPDPPDCELIFGGWSWKTLDFRAWHFHYVPSRGIMDFSSFGGGVSIGRDHPIIFAGTRAAVEQARDRIIELLKEREMFRTGVRYFDMEPFEVLRDIIREQKFPDVGGPPQIIKVYQSGNSKPFAVKWEMTHSREIAVLGRPLFPKEKTHLSIIDPDNINFIPQKTLEKKKKLAAQKDISSDKMLRSG